MEPLVRTALSIPAAGQVSARTALGSHHTSTLLLDCSISEKVILPFYVESVCYNVAPIEKHDLSSCICCTGQRSFDLVWSLVPALQLGRCSGCHT